MLRRLALVITAVGSVVLAGCPSKDTQSSGGATAPSSASSGGTGPLASLESAPFVNETWSLPDGQPAAFIHFGPQNVRVSAACRKPTGELACDAIRQLRSAPPVVVSNAQLTGGISAGTRVCLTLKHALVTGRNPAGGEDGFCRFPDGSLVSTGALEQYALQIAP